MCGIAGVIHHGGKQAPIGAELTSMLQTLRHRGPDSTGFALYGKPEIGRLVMRFKVAERTGLGRGISVREELQRRKAEVDRRIELMDAKIHTEEEPTEYAFRYDIECSGDIRELARFIEEVDDVEILSIGDGLELVKDLGDASEVSAAYGLSTFQGTHGIGHSRMATESDVDIRSAHPYWAFPFKDLAVVHNGQLTNYWTGRRALEREGHRFHSDCDSELISVYLADKVDRGIDLETAMHHSIEDFDGVFTYVVATEGMLGLAKDRLHAKPMVLYEGDGLVALASEEVAIRSIVPHEIDTTDPYEGVVKVWAT
jgi:glutamate synthase domain-containing protein 1